jgi:hypothetical protein
MTMREIAARVRRLDDLARGLAKEIVLVQEASDRLLYVERKAYLAGLQRALAGVEEARVVLARARQRLEYGQPECRGPPRANASKLLYVRGSNQDFFEILRVQGRGFALACDALLGGIPLEQA